MSLALSGLALLTPEVAFAKAPDTALSMVMVKESAPLGTSSFQREATVTLLAADFHSFSDLMQTARSLTSALIDTTFAEDSTLAAITVHILGEGKDVVVPLGVTSVSRSDWRSQPDLDRWSQWFGGSAQALLGFGLATNQPTTSQTDSTAGNNPDVIPRGRSAGIRRHLLQSN